MDNILDVTIERLINLEIQIYESYETLYKSKPKKNIFKIELEKLRYLTTKEDELIQSLTHDTDVLYSFYEEIYSNRDKYFGNDESAAPIHNRITQIISNLHNTYEDEELIENFDSAALAEIEFDKESTKNHRAVRNNLYLKFIEFISFKMELYGEDEKSKEAQYKLIFENKELSDLLIENDFDIKKMSFLSDIDLIRKMRVSRETYDYLTDVDKCEYVEEVMLEIFKDISNSNETEDPHLSNKIMEFEFLLSQLTPERLLPLEEGYHDYAKDFNNYHGLQEQVFEIVKTAISKIPEKTSKKQPKERTTISEETFDSLVSLIKLEQRILEIFYDIDLNNLDNDKKYDEIKYLISIETTLIDKIKITPATSDIIYEIITRDIYFFLDNTVTDYENKSKLISQRIYQILPFYQKVSSSPNQIQKSYFQINQNHILNSLRIYRKYIIHAPKENQESMWKVYKNVFYTTKSLLSDLVMSGNYLMIDSLSDEVSAEITYAEENSDSSLLKYSYDKDEQLFKRAEELINEILEIENYETDLDAYALFQFKMAELMDIMNNISTEHLYALPEIVKELAPNSHTKKILLNKIKRQKKKH